VAELVDALDSGSSIRKDVLVRFQSSAPIKIKGYGIFRNPFFVCPA
jgi:hypothetical protein